jgi:aquaporin NIP
VREFFAEAIGTFALVFAGTGAIVIDQVSHGGVTHVGIAMTFGLTVMAIIYAIGDISGAHLNPAVTVGFLLSGKFPSRRVIPYILSQLLGAFAASALLRGLFGNVALLGTTLPAGSAAQTFILESVLTALLMYVILCVSNGPKEVGVMAGIAVGGVIGLEALFAGPISGASMNPARSLAPAVLSDHLTYVWIYLTAPFVGSVIAVPCWKLTHGQPLTAPEYPPAAHSSH